VRAASKIQPLLPHNYRLIYQISLVFLLFLFPSAILAQPTIVLNTAADEPLSTKSQNGFLDEIAVNIFNKIGYSVAIKKLPAERALRSANRGLIDGEIARVAGLNKVYSNLIRIPEKIMNWGFFVFSKKPINLQQGWNALRDKNVAIITGWKILEKNTPKTAFITKVKNSRQLFTLLEKNRTDIVIYEHWGGSFIVNQSKLNNVSMVRPALINKDMFIYLHKKHSALVPRLSQALVNMKRDGSYDRLAKKHLLPIHKIN
jgi:polar amino acid transport system substrate-binding protein